MCRIDRANISVFAAFLIHFILGTFYTYGNMNPYITSYLRHFVDSTISYTGTIWIFTCLGLGWGLGGCIAGYMEKWLGLALTCTFSASLVSWGVLLTYFTIRISLFTTVITYGVLYGFGIGMGYIAALSAAMSWYPEHEGLVSGIVLSGFGGSPFLFDYLQTKFINGHNIKPSSKVLNDTYFDDETVLNKVPEGLILFGGIYAAVLIISIIMLRRKVSANIPSMNTTESTNNTISSSHENTTETPLVLRMLRTRNFRILWLCMLLNSTASNTLTSLYKAFGLSSQNDEISDDTFLALAGSFSAAANMLGRLIWGPLSDYFPYKKLMSIQTMGMGSFLLCFYYIVNLDRATFILWMVIMHGFIAGNFALFPIITSKTFGRENVSAVYGLILSGFALAAVLSGVLNFVSKTFDKAAWRAVFMVSAFCCFLSFVLNSFFDPNEKCKELERDLPASTSPEQGHEGADEAELLSDEFNPTSSNEIISLTRQTQLVA